jgi:hypothetical protein
MVRGTSLLDPVNALKIPLITAHKGVVFNPFQIRGFGEKFPSFFEKPFLDAHTISTGFAGIVEGAETRGFKHQCGSLLGSSSI